MTWPPRDGRAFIALAASIIGGGGVMATAIGVVLILWRGGWADETALARIEWLGIGLLMLIGGAIMVLLALGFAINRRSFKAGRDGFELSGGDDLQSGDSVTLEKQP